MKNAVIEFLRCVRAVYKTCFRLLARKFLGNMNCMVLPSSMYSLVVHLLKGDVRYVARVFEHWHEQQSLVVEHPLVVEARLSAQSEGLQDGFEKRSGTLSPLTAIERTIVKPLTPLHKRETIEMKLRNTLNFSSPQIFIFRVI